MRPFLPLAGAAFVAGRGLATAPPNAASEPARLDAGMLQSIGLRAGGVPPLDADAAVGALPAPLAGQPPAGDAADRAGEEAAPIAAALEPPSPEPPSPEPLSPEPLSPDALAIIGPAAMGADAAHLPSAWPVQATAPADDARPMRPVPARLPVELESDALQGIAVRLHQPADPAPARAAPEPVAPAEAAPPPAVGSGAAAPPATTPPPAQRPAPPRRPEPAAVAATAPAIIVEKPVAPAVPPATADPGAPLELLTDAVMTTIGLRPGPIDTP